MYLITNTFTEKKKKPKYCMLTEINEQDKNIERFVWSNF